MVTAHTKLIDWMRHNGVLSVADYIGFCLFDPEHGYYRTHRAIGRSGDFMTAPEISQMFGEVLGLWILSLWEKMGSPHPLSLIELGPGRGTLMKDVCRVLKLRPALFKNLSLHFLEINPHFAAQQQESFKGMSATWHDSLDHLLDTCDTSPCFILANEFFDVLPVHQYVYTGEWFERSIRYDLQEDRFSFCLTPTSSIIKPTLQGYPPPQNNNIVELSPQRDQCFSQLLTHLKQRTGGMLLIDYGYTTPLYGDSLQGMKTHQYVDVLKNPGTCDLTTHVNFWQLLRLCSTFSINAHVSTQSDFLNRWGITARAATLTHKKPPEIQAQIQKDLARLVHPQKMGNLFKALEVSVLT
jgi:SAM-dependent MidA family methyltransferase